MYVAENCGSVSTSSLSTTSDLAASIKIVDASSSPHSGMCIPIAKLEIKLIWSSANFHAHCDQSDTCTCCLS